jgi:3D (Asp-Asp-Asp) domain-containing protein
MSVRSVWIAGAIALVAGLLAGCASLDAPPEKSLVVSASAYNALPGQTDGDPDLAAWGDRLEPGMRVIAVSHDLIPLGLRRGVQVEIDGLPGRFRVLDKMGPRWRRKIDIFMGDDVQAARRWGVRRVRIRWRAGSGLSTTG